MKFVNKLHISSFRSSVFAILLISYFFLGFSEELAFKNCNNFIGFKASNISGYGLYYSKTLTEYYRLQGMGIAYYYKRSKGSESRVIINYDIGLEIQRFVYIGEIMRAYILAGGYYYFDDDTEKLLVETQVINHSYNIGIGLGFEFYYKRLVFNIDLGYKFFEDNLKTYIDDEYQYPELERTTKVGAGLGMGFMF
ncbi:MAG: hypothetical protein KAS62_11705 [Candidatus Delongbacteria bacterium]|nr:hypothetical protein [Candidatus Delongbacteria bacterium]